MNLTLGITNRCNYDCKHCGVESGLHDRRRLTVEEMKDYIDQAAAMQDEGLKISITGGEPFLCFEDVVEIIAHAKTKKAQRIGLVTNCHWATSYDLAIRKLKTLQQAGLSAISFSVDEFHLQNVPIENVRTAFRAAADLDIYVGIKVVVFKDSSRAADFAREMQDLTLGRTISIEEIPCLPVGRARSLPDEMFLYTPGLPQGRCHGLGGFVVECDGTFFTCCVPGWPKRLSCGNARHQSIADMVDHASNTSFLLTMRANGPAYFVPFFEEAGVPIARDRFVSECHLCQTLLTAADESPQGEAALQAASQAWFAKQADMGNALSVIAELVCE
jgi:pyruvate-formate lyase-activating enzyme